jgi:ABC-type dipeptide/oligopeptide/nickel transport system permease component
MSQREKYDYHVYHWYIGGASYYNVYPNLNRRVEPGRKDQAWKKKLLNDKRFRQAMSLGMNRWAMIETEYNNQTVPAQSVPDSLSPFYVPSAFTSYVEYDTVRANRLLDEIGLTKRDYEGYRTFPDGTRMTFYMYFTKDMSYGFSLFISQDLAELGIRVLLRERSRVLYVTEREALKHDFSVWGGHGEYIPILAPKVFVPSSTWSSYAIGYAKWYMRGGLYGDPRAKSPGAIEPPLDHPLRRAMEIYEEVKGVSELEKQVEIFSEAIEIAAENLWGICVSTTAPALVVVKKGVKNVPEHAMFMWPFRFLGSSCPETFYFEKSHDSPGAITQMKSEIITPVLAHKAAVDKGDAGTDAGILGSVLGYGFLLILLALLVLLCIRHPFVLRRLVILVPTLLFISVMTFFIIHFPPGDFLAVKIMQLQEMGDESAMEEIKNLKEIFSLDHPMWKQYSRWMGFDWFFSFESKDRGLLQGHMGLGMESLRSINELVGDRILLTLLISLGTIFFTWAVAIPIGIYSAVRQYTPGDYLFTFLGFIGMCIPSFLLALLLMYFSAEVFDFPVSGLFSSEYSARPEWTFGKVVDLLKHIWVPVVVLGVGGTAWMVRVMRANLLDELKKPYVVTARAKGVRPMKLLFKYPVRLALNPFISGIGVLFPQLVSGGAIVAMVLSLPTVGPMLLTALMTEDMYLAGSMLMVLSVLGVLGTLVSDLLLLWLDPRIRFESSGR